MSSSKPSKPAQAAGELSGLLQKAEALQRELERAQADLKSEEVEAEDGGGRVFLRLNGEGEPREVRVNLPGLGENDRAALEEALTASLKAAMERLFQLRKRKLGSITKGLNLPNLYL